MLQEVIKKYGLNEKLETGRVFAEWKNWVPGPVAQNTEPVKLKNGVLFVKVTDDAWRSELPYQKKNLLDIVNRNMNKKFIKDIKFI